jgi:response regulator RpfG family c-di-GMP phosphodiesterase
MSGPQVSILVVDDDANVLKALARLELGAQFALRCCSTTAEARAVIARGEADVALVDQHLGRDEPKGLDFLAELRERDPDCFRIIFTGAADLDFAVNAINHGRIDAFLVKPWSNEHLVALLNQGGETSLLRRHNRQLGQELSQRNAALEYLNRELERMVEERTAHLRETLDQLKEKQHELIRLETQGAVSQIARGLAHELNNPLAAILGYAQRMQRNLVHDADSSRRLTVILGEVESCRGLVEQLRNLAEPLDETALPCQAEQALDQALARLRANDIVPPECRIDGVIPPVLAAPRSLARVFEQILDNARLAGATYCRFSAQGGPERVRLMFDNDGETPSAEVLRGAVRPFFTTRAQHGHRGLGLAIASALLREQDGTIELVTRGEAVPGACCAVTLPAPAEMPFSLVPQAALEPVGAVLIVDDNPMITELLEDCLSDAGLAVVVVSSAKDALAAVEQSPIRAVIADVHLNGSSGIDLLQRLTARQPGLTGHVALITGDNDRISLAKLEAQAGVPVLAKPFRLEQIHKLVRDIL